MPLRRYVMRRHLNKSDRIGIETCYALYYAAVSSSDIVQTAVSVVREKIDGKVQVQYFSKAQLKQLFRRAIFHVQPAS